MIRVTEVGFGGYRAHGAVRGVATLLGALRAVTGNLSSVSASEASNRINPGRAALTGGCSTRVAVHSFRDIRVIIA
ncbi:hypothetical protein D5S18_19070 [Nocardia panacis]|uniref:Uncharacterized protein n=1 Tax=Nocardia panacis TaxID=2340916 RepID=A0A3A4KFY2_9NOCA|nr:hypothetical protein D5S18_19070 [Nocardia panacis]